MLDYIIGKIICFENNEVTLETNDKGYKIFYLDNINDLVINSKVKFFLCNIENDFEKLSYGFLNIKRRDIFNDLIKIKTVGTKTAITIISKYDSDNFKQIIKNNDIDKILEIKGIGNFTARLIISELTKKYFNFKWTKKQEKIIHSLEKIGFKTKDIFICLKDINQDLTVEEMIKQTLERINFAHESRI